MAYLDKNGLTRLWNKIKGLVEGKQDKITSDNKLSYTLLSNTPTIPSIEFTQKTTSGINIGDITINGDTTPIYAPTSDGEATTLYTNSTGTNGAFTLSDSAENYKMLEFFFRNDVNQYGSTRIYEPNGKRVNFSIVVYNTTTAKCYIQSSAKNINGTSITNYSSSEYAVGGSLSTGNYIYITKVIGYK